MSQWQTSLISPNHLLKVCLIKQNTVTSSSLVRAIKTCGFWRIHSKTQNFLAERLEKNQWLILTVCGDCKIGTVRNKIKQIAMGRAPPCGVTVLRGTKPSNWFTTFFNKTKHIHYWWKNKKQKVNGTMSSHTDGKLVIFLQFIFNNCFFCSVVKAMTAI